MDAAAASAAAATGLAQSATARDPKKVVIELIRCTFDVSRNRISIFLKKIRSKLTLNYVKTFGAIMFRLRDKRKNDEKKNEQKLSLITT